MKYLKPTYVPDNAPPTPPTDQAEVNLAQPVQAQIPQTLRTAFTGEDAKALLGMAQDISNVHPSQKAESWQTWATAVCFFYQLVSAYLTSMQYPQHSAQEWQNFWEANIRPIYLKQLAKEGMKIEKPTAPVSPEEIDEAHLHKSPSRNPSSSKVLSRSPLQERMTHRPSPQKAEVVRTASTSSSEDESVDPRSVRVLPDSNRSLKRKRTTVEGHHPTSSPPNYLTSQAVKRQRGEKGVARPTEIPSTPERFPLTECRTTPIVIKREIGYLEDDESAVDQEEGDEGEEEAEDEEYDEVDLPRAPSQSLSEPDYHHPKPWSLSRGPRRRLNFEIPPPVGGWNDEDDLGGSLQGPEIGSQRRGRQDTQGLLRETPQIDFTVAEPDEGWDLLVPPLPSSPPGPTSQTATDEDDRDSTPDVVMTERDLIAKLETWIDARINSGIDVDHIDLALKSASNHPDLADVVLEALQRGEGVPDDVKGVWTKEDDECLEAVDARRIDQMIGKHGREALDRRYEFLRLYNEVEG